MHAGSYLVAHLKGYNFKPASADQILNEGKQFERIRLFA